MPPLRNLGRKGRNLQLAKSHRDPAASLRRLKRQRVCCPLNHRPRKQMRPTRPAYMGPSPAKSPDPSERAVASRCRSPLVPAVRFGMHLSPGRVERQHSIERPLQSYAKPRRFPRRLAPDRVIQSRSVFAKARCDCQGSRPSCRRTQRQYHGDAELWLVRRQLRVMSGRFAMREQCPLYPQKQTCSASNRMSAKCQKRTFCRFPVLRLERQH